MVSGDKNRVIVLAVIEGGLTVSEAAGRFGVTRQWVHRLLARYRMGGLEALEPRSRAPRTSPTAVSDEVRDAIVSMRDNLVADGWKQVQTRSATGSSPPVGHHRHGPRSTAS